MKVLDFWFSIGSTYTYLSVMRIGDLCARHEIKINWIPFNVREILAPIGGSPFPDSKPQKKAYMWRDIERRAKKFNLAPLLPASYPLEHFEQANLLATFSSIDGWCAEYTYAAYKLWFECGIPPGTVENANIVAGQFGKSAEALIQAANKKEVSDLLAINTEKARQLGIFGAPNFLANGELFWGDDRLEEAVEWLSKH